MEIYFIRGAFYDLSSVSVSRARFAFEGRSGHRRLSADKAELDDDGHVGPFRLSHSLLRELRALITRREELSGIAEPFQQRMRRMGDKSTCEAKKN